MHPGHLEGRRSVRSGQLRHADGRGVDVHGYLRGPGVTAALAGGREAASARNASASPARKSVMVRQ